ncbi:ferredoxin reductase [Planosporangium flavigriseum]|uniref:ferredoxin reductase n=1 Tax=Planosporangium flavigriseum TaxID=373681 RepID=UPI00143BF51B|nr:ferredoxin reductase [Planosporangium flavigriseum]NJC66622.1 ferredoxin reductase [Planosporangium flavigriseum]
MAVRQRLLDAVTWLTTPLLPDDYLGLLNPLWSARQLRGRVEAVLPETADAATLVIHPGQGWTPHRAGQYARVGVDVDGVRHWRSYSLSSPPERADGRITITVKADPTGLVSPYLVRRVTPGTIVYLAPAQGEFTLPELPPDRLLFVTGGSGITPVAAMLRSLALHNQVSDVVLVHSAPTPADVIFGTELRALAARLPSLRLYERHTRTDGRLTMAQLRRLCPDWRQRHVWACGPTGMLDEVERHWRRTKLADRLHVERFRPPVTAGGAGGRVRFVASGRQADADGTTPLLVIGENAGVLMPSGCRMGICYSCVARLRSGRVRDLRTGREHGDEGELVQTCVSAAAGPVEIDL